MELNLEKTIVLVGQSTSNAVALQKQRDYMRKGLLEQNVLIHPDNVIPLLKSAQSCMYGAACLGVPVGTVKA